MRAGGAGPGLRAGAARAGAAEECRAAGSARRPRRLRAGAPLVCTSCWDPAPLERVLAAKAQALVARADAVLIIRRHRPAQAGEKRSAGVARQEEGHLASEADAHEAARGASRLEGTIPAWRSVSQPRYGRATRGGRRRAGARPGHARSSDSLRSAGCGSNSSRRSSPQPPGFRAGAPRIRRDPRVCTGPRGAPRSPRRVRRVAQSSASSRDRAMPRTACGPV